ncbi:MAG: hypothetical protein GYB65_15975, partial [Chloroflexi bacterium]|nr:hypothetical protein [Chloroflexota bacterium]
MGNHRLRKVAHSLVTGLVLATLLVTTFAPNWVSRIPAAPGYTGQAEAATTYEEADMSAASTPSVVSSPALAPMNALVISEPDRMDSLQRAITRGGGYVYVRQGNTLLVGMHELTPGDLTLAGASAVYEDVVSEDDLALLDPVDRDAAQVWNQLANTDSTLDLDALPDDFQARTSTYLSTPSADSSSPARVDDAPGPNATSVYMVGSVTVQVVFVESQGSTENWSQSEIDKVKAEVVSALDWWSTAATTPANPGGESRPPAFLTWNVNYFSPLEGSQADRDKVTVTTEPIQGSIAQGQNGWMIEVAQEFAPGGAASIRNWANEARNTPGQETDWGMVLFVVDSSNDADGAFNGDGKAGGALLNGPWATVTYDGGDLGVSNLEALIAKMVGHVFGAGDEYYDITNDAGCQNDEILGYFLVEHSNCERNNPVPETSAMRAGDNMLAGYREFRLSDSARAQVGWRESDGDGVYDVLDTIQDMFTVPGTDPICPILHIAGVEVLNEAAVPFDFGLWGDGSGGWSPHIWDENTDTYIDPGFDEPGVSPYYQRTNINWLGYVWGRINEGDWIAGSPSSGIAFDSDNTGYNLMLPGNPGEINSVEIVLMNRWEQEAFRPEEEEILNITFADSVGAGSYESNNANVVATYFADGTPGGWTETSDISYSGGSSLTAQLPGSEACFSIEGQEVTLLYTQSPAYGTGTVYVDGELHSTITYTGVDAPQSEHIITNLSSGDHTVQLFVSSGMIDFDAFQVSTTVSNGV